MDRDDSMWVSASSVRNFILKDPIVDWLNLYYPEKPSNESAFNQSLLQRGTEFESKVYEYLCGLHGQDKIFKVASQPGDVYDKNLFLLTKQKMREKVPIIYQGIVLNETTKTGGIPDLLVRNDYMDRLLKGPSEPPSEKPLEKPSETPSETPSDHYTVVDIKLSTLKFRCDEKHLLNSGNMPYYKAQLFMYTDALNSMQNFCVDKAYVLGRRQETYYLCLGEVDFSGIDKVSSELVPKAVEWLRKVRTDGRDWVLFPTPSVEELKPNMRCSSFNEKWQKVKKDIAERQGEITLLYRCNLKKRKIAEDQGVNKWQDCTSDVLKIKNPKISKTIDRMVEVSKSNNLEPLSNPLPERLLVHLREQPVEVYIDFETCSVPDTFENLAEPIGDQTFVFMIGCGRQARDEDGVLTWIYESYVADSLSEEAERRMFENFRRDLRAMNPNRIFAWGTTEKNFYKKVLGTDIEDEKYVDLLKIFRDNSIVIKGVLNFSLKTIAKALFNLGKIQTTWDDGEDNALDVISKAQRIYQSSCVVVNEPEMQTIIRYNEVDCKTMLEIVEFLRRC